MIEPEKIPKTSYDLAKALSRWESEGGAEEVRDRAENTSSIVREEAEGRILRRLGAAVILQWNDLPTEIQRDSRSLDFFMITRTTRIQNRDFSLTVISTGPAEKTIRATAGCVQSCPTRVGGLGRAVF